MPKVKLRLRFTYFDIVKLKESALGSSFLRMYLQLCANGIQMLPIFDYLLCFTLLFSKYVYSNSKKRTLCK